jgi:hypothetical protein
MRANAVRRAGTLANDLLVAVTVVAAMVAPARGDTLNFGFSFTKKGLGGV